MQERFNSSALAIRSYTFLALTHRFGPHSDLFTWINCSNCCFHKKCSWTQSTMCSEITHLKLLHIPEVNELIHSWIKKIYYRIRSRIWLGAKQALSHCLSHWELSSLALCLVNRRSCTVLWISQCWKFPQVRQSGADNFGGGPGTFCWFFFNFMFMIWESRLEDLQLFDWVSNTGISPNLCIAHHGEKLKSPKSFLGCPNYFELSLKEICY